jgi:hypothetical protein
MLSESTFNHLFVNSRDKSDVNLSMKAIDYISENPEVLDLILDGKINNLRDRI